MNAIEAPVHVAQRTFRALLTALSHPGRITAIDDSVDAPEDLGPALGAAAFALFDRDVTVWLTPPQRAQIGEWLVARTGCRLAGEPRDAQFAVILDVEDALPLQRWNCGTAEDPEESATLLVRVAAFGSGDAVSLAGPGIATDVSLAVRALPPRFWFDWSANATLYPLGIDCFFFDATRVVGVPRTVTEHVR